MVQRWVIQVDGCRYLICGNAQSGYKFGEIKRAFRFTNRDLVATKCEELQSQGYNVMVCPVKKMSYAPVA